MREKSIRQSHLLSNPEAEASYRQAAGLGGPTQPGLSLLRLTQGEIEKALLGIRRALAETSGQLERLDLLTAAVTVMLAAGDKDAARHATAELAGIAAVYTTPGVQAELAAARGTVAFVPTPMCIVSRGYCIRLRRSAR
jgi:hypothetical protein